MNQTGEGNPLETAMFNLSYLSLEGTMDSLTLIVMLL